MMLLLSIGLNLVSSAVVLIPVFLVWNGVRLHSLRKCALYCLFGLYLSAVYHLVGMPDVTYIRFELSGNLIPFAGMLDGLRSTLENVALFVPLGLLLPLLWNRYRAAKCTVLFGFGMSLAIELLQVFTYRATDINDLITNTVGTLIGYCLASALLRKIPSLREAVNEKNHAELYTLCAAVFAVMFFIHPFLFNLAWQLAAK